MARKNATESADLTGGQTAPTQTAAPPTAPPTVEKPQELHEVLNALHRRLKGKKSTRVVVATKAGEYKYSIPEMLETRTGEAFREAADVYGVKATEPEGFIVAVENGKEIKRKVNEGGTYAGKSARELTNKIFGLTDE